jgi:hypothetical protein
MSVALERRTVSLWAVDESPLRTGPRRGAHDPSVAALAAITSSYRNGRAGIIAGDAVDAARSAGPISEPSPTHLPTVPVPFVPKPVLPALRADEGLETRTFWSRLGRSRRGRHAPKA